MTDIEYWENIAKIKKDILEKIIFFGIDTNECDDEINPFYNQIIDNGGIGLEFYDGLPYKLYTPLGSIKIISGMAEGGNEKELLEELIKDYKLQKTEEKYGRLGPIYSITYLPEEEKELPLFKKKKMKDYISPEEAIEIYKKMNNSNKITLSVKLY